MKTSETGDIGTYFLIKILLISMLLFPPMSVNIHMYTNMVIDQKRSKITYKNIFHTDGLFLIIAYKISAGRIVHSPTDNS